MVRCRHPDIGECPGPGGPGNWGQAKKLVASAAQTNHSFGSSVAVWGDTAIVGTRNPPANPLSEAGAAYVFEGNWLYVLDSYGGLYTAGGAPSIIPPTPYFGFDIARDLELR